MDKFFFVILLVVAIGVMINHLIFVNAKDQSGELKMPEDQTPHSKNRYLEKSKTSLQEYGDEIPVKFVEGYNVTETEDVGKVSDKDSSIRLPSESDFSNSVKESERIDLDAINSHRLDKSAKPASTSAKKPIGKTR